jgi:RNA polymerase sigma-70 factor (ECF subfamily)
MTDTVSESVLVERARQGDELAFAALVEGSHAQVRGFLAARSPSLDLAEECLQQAYVTAWQKLAEFRGDAPFAAWVKGIARMNLLSELRRRRRSVALDNATGVAALVDACLADAERDDDLLPRLRDCLDKLDPQARELLSQRYRDGLELNDLAIAYTRSANALAVTLHRLRGILRRCLDGAPAGGAA